MDLAKNTEITNQNVPASQLLNEDLVPDKILVGERLYAAAIDIVLSNAQQELLIFDQDLSHGDFASVRKYELIQQFLAKDEASRLVIILQDARYFQTSCPRLFNLLEVYGHKMTVYETNTSAKHAKDCFMIADARHYIKRIHIDQPRFRYAFDDNTSVEGLNMRFEELLDATQEAVSPTTLGL